MTRAAATVGNGPRRGAVSVRHLAPALGAGVLASCRVLGFARGTGSCRQLQVGLWTQWRSGQDVGSISSGGGCGSDPFSLSLCAPPLSARECDDDVVDQCSWTLGDRE